MEQFFLKKANAILPYSEIIYEGKNTKKSAIGIHLYDNLLYFGIIANNHPKQPFLAIILRYILSESKYEEIYLWESREAFHHIFMEEDNDYQPQFGRD